MTKKLTTATKTIGAIMAVGGAAALITSTMSSSSSKRQMKKKTDKAIDTITGIIDSIQSVM